VAAAFCLAPQLASQPAAQAAAYPAAVADAAHLLSPADLMAVTRPAPAHKPHSGRPSRYTVRPDDSLSAIAGHFYHNPGAWPVLYWANRSQIRWADEIRAGQVLRIPVNPAQIPSAPELLGPPAPAADASGPAQAGAALGTSWSGGRAGGAFGQCVIARESGGQSQVMNSSGHYGLYQFSASTWAEYGGSPADFGHASVAEQNQVFANALASGGESNWSSYDGC
jgi:Transglycosylase-like domain/LysM domain